ncbi:MAG: hypothetical protein DRG59_02045 [Deltaproteobacteria bacterium]|nr:MAG: hypothetical protein DRG59_02045 [Deltaproteobacteria bacterium]
MKLAVAEMYIHGISTPKVAAICVPDLIRERRNCVGSM